jgi:ribosomal protein S18 acetylase RimI-like enzyme
MVIEIANVFDAEQILALQKLAYISEAIICNDFNIPPLLQTIEELKKDFQDHTFLKLVVNHKIIGSVRALVQDGNCYIGRLMVHPDHQNQGSGTRLIIEIEALFDLCHRFELFTGVKSVKNIKFYQKLDYQIYKTEKVFDNLSFVYLEKVVSPLKQH